MCGATLGIRRTRAGAAAVLLLVLATLVVVGRLALDAWVARPVPADPPQVAARGGPPPPFLLVVIDGVREDALRDVHGTPMPYTVSLGRRGVSGTAMTGDPTLSGPCIRTILSGQAPDLFAAFVNIRAVPAKENVVGYLVERGARAAHAGDIVIPNLLGPVHRPGDVLDLTGHAFSAIEEMDDLAFPFALAKSSEPGIDALTVHLVFADLTGHRFGGLSPEYAAACRVVDDRLRAVVEAFLARRPDAVVLVAADHGLSARGSHGSGEAEARRAPFVLVGPRVARRAGVEIPQAALATTLAAVLGLPQPPLAAAPPALELTTLSPEEGRAALDEYLRARIAVARRIGAGDVADQVEARRAKAWLEGSQGASLAALLDADRELEADAFSNGGVPAGILALSLAALALAFLAGRGARTMTLACFAAVPVVGGTGFILVDTVLDAATVPPVVFRAAAVAVLLFGASWLVLRRPATRPRLRGLLAERPGLLLVLGGTALGLVAAMRFGIDYVVHTPILFAALAGIGVLTLVLSRAAREHAPRARWLLLGVAAVLLGGGRLAEALWKDGWMESAEGRGLPWILLYALGLAVLAWDAFRDGARAAGWLTLGAVIGARLLQADSDAEPAAFALLAVGCRLAGRIPGRRTRGGVAHLALLLLVVRMAAFHATGHIESYGTINVGGRLLPGSAVSPGSPGVGAATAEDLREAALLALRFGLVWLVLLAAAARSLARTGSRDAVRLLASDLAVAYLARGAVLVAGLWAWSRWTWWTVIAYPVYVLGALDVASLVAALVLVGGFAGGRTTRRRATEAVSAVPEAGFAARAT